MSTNLKKLHWFRVMSYQLARSTKKKKENLIEIDIRNMDQFYCATLGILCSHRSMNKFIQLIENCSIMNFKLVALKIIRGITHYFIVCSLVFTLMYTRIYDPFFFFFFVQLWPSVVKKKERAINSILFRPVFICVNLCCVNVTPACGTARKNTYVLYCWMWM